MSEDIVALLREEHAEEKQLGNDFLADVIWKAADEIERLRKERDRYWATTNDAISERNYWIRLFMLAFDSHFDKTWDGETADLLGQAYDEAECICGDDKL